MIHFALQGSDAYVSAGPPWWSYPIAVVVLIALGKLWFSTYPKN